MSTIEINPTRLMQTIESIAMIGATEGGGSCRLALTDEDRQARDRFADWCKAAGAEVTFDRFGNIFARRPGVGRQPRVVMTGSHLDTQPHGGRLDGIYGVLAGLEVLRTLNEHDIQTEHDVVVANWTNEEGVRFSPGLTGSSGFSASLPAQKLLGLPSTEGPTFGEELSRIGYAGDDLPCPDILGYIEAHIEQGPILETAHTTIGVVQGIQEVRWFEVTITGSDRHAGTTPAALRQDSFLATSALTTAMNKICLEIDPEIRFTVGRVEVSPGSTNTVPGLTRFTIDLRHPSTERLDQVVEAFAVLIRHVDQHHRVNTTLSQSMLVPAVHFDAHCIDVVAQSAVKAGYSSMPIVSGAMHDASRIAAIAPTAMLFVPSRDGISHHEEEWTSPEDLAAGCQVLLIALLALAQEKR